MSFRANGFRNTGIITISSKGDFKNTETFLKNASNINSKIESILLKYAEEGLDALRANTPVDTGKTAASWSYEISNGDNYCSIVWSNDNVNNGVNIAVILEYGHGTRNGGYVRGHYYIKPALEPVFEKIKNELWKEVTS